MFDISDGDEVSMTHELSVDGVGETSQIGSISLDRLPDQFIS